MQFGVISLSDLTADPNTGRPVAALDWLDDTLAYARAADELGLDVFALGEHHGHSCTPPDRPPGSFSTSHRTDADQLTTPTEAAPDVAALTVGVREVLLGTQELQRGQTRRPPPAGMTRGCNPRSSSLGYGQVSVPPQMGDERRPISRIGEERLEFADFSPIEDAARNPAVLQ